MIRPLSRFVTVAAVATLAVLAAFPGPARAQESAKDEPKVKPFETAQLGENAWYGRFGFTNCSWIDMGDGVLVVDSGGTGADAANLQAEIKRTTKGKPVRWIVLTHLHEDSNGGLASLLPADVTVFANQRVAPGMAVAFEKRSVPGKRVTVVGVIDALYLIFGSHPFEILVPRGSAHTDHDLYAFAPELGAAFVGDLVTPGRCPMMSDPNADPKKWLDELDRILALQPVVLIASRGDAAVRTDPKVTTTGLDLDKEVKATRAYIERMVKIVTEAKKMKAPEARVASELKLNRVGNYCPGELDNINGLSLFRRLTPEGDFATGAPPKSALPKK